MRDEDELSLRAWKYQLCVYYRIGARKDEKTERIHGAADAEMIHQQIVTGRYLLVSITKRAVERSPHQSRGSVGAVWAAAGERSASRKASSQNSP